MGATWVQYLASPGGQGSSGLVALPTGWTCASKSGDTEEATGLEGSCRNGGQEFTAWRAAKMAGFKSIDCDYLAQDLVRLGAYGSLKALAARQHDAGVEFNFVSPSGALYGLWGQAGEGQGVREIRVIGPHVQRISTLEFAAAGKSAVVEFNLSASYFAFKTSHCENIDGVSNQQLS